MVREREERVLGLPGGVRRAVEEELVGGGVEEELPGCAGGLDILGWKRRDPVEKGSLRGKQEWKTGSRTDVRTGRSMSTRRLADRHHSPPQSLSILFSNSLGNEIAGIFFLPNTAAGDLLSARR